MLLHLLVIDLESELVGSFAETTDLIQILKKVECSIGSTYEVRV